MNSFMGASPFRTVRRSVLAVGAAAALSVTGIAAPAYAAASDAVTAPASTAASGPSMSHCMAIMRAADGTQHRACPDPAETGRTAQDPVTGGPVTGGPVFVSPTQPRQHIHLHCTHLIRLPSRAVQGC